MLEVMSLTDEGTQYSADPPKHDSWASKYVEPEISGLVQMDNELTRTC